MFNLILHSLLRIALVLLGIAISQSAIFAQNGRMATVSLEGQFVCSQCWTHEDRKKTPYGTAADMECAEECAEQKVPPAIAVKQGDDYKLFEIEEGKFKRPGENWLVYIGKQVRVEGRLVTAKDSEHILLDGLKVIGENPLALQNAVGTTPELVLKDLFGVDQSLSAYRGKIVVLNFWATWCIPCRKEMPDLAAIQSDYAALGVQVVGATADPMSDRPKILAFIKETRINFPVWIGVTTEHMKRFGLGPALPGTAVIGRDGKIISATGAVIRPSELRKAVDGLLAADARAVQLDVASTKHSHDTSLVPS